MEELISRPITWSPIQLDNTELKPNDQVEAYEETGEFPSDVEFVELQTDVGWYGRQCRKRLRDQVISCQMLLAILLSRSLLETPFPFVRVPHVLPDRIRTLACMHAHLMCGCVRSSLMRSMGQTA